MDEERFQPSDETCFKYVYPDGIREVVSCWPGFPFPIPRVGDTVTFASGHGEREEHYTVREVEWRFRNGLRGREGEAVIHTDDHYTASIRIYLGDRSEQPL